MLGTPSTSTSLPPSCYFLLAVWESVRVIRCVQWLYSDCTVVVCTLRYSYTGFHLPPVQRSAMTPPPPPPPPPPDTSCRNFTSLPDLVVCPLYVVGGERRGHLTESPHLYILHWVSLPGSAGAVEPSLLPRLTSSCYLYLSLAFLGPACLNTFNTTTTTTTTTSHSPRSELSNSKVPPVRIGYCNEVSGFLLIPRSGWKL